LVGKPEGKYHLKDVVLDMWVVIKYVYVKEVGQEGANWMDMDKWWAVVNTVLNLQIP
jgi:hypothetical protein